MANSFQKTVSGPVLTNIPHAAVVDPTAASGVASAFTLAEQAFTGVQDFKQQQFKKELTTDLETGIAGDPEQEADIFGEEDAGVKEITSLGQRLNQAKRSGQISSTELLARLESKVQDRIQQNPAMSSRYRAAFSEARGDFQHRLTLLNQQASASAARQTKTDKYIQEKEVQSLKTGIPVDKLVAIDGAIERDQIAFNVITAQGNVQATQVGTRTSQGFSTIQLGFDVDAYEAADAGGKAQIEQSTKVQMQQFAIQQTASIDGLMASGKMSAEQGKEAKADIRQQLSDNLAVIDSGRAATLTKDILAHVKDLDSLRIREQYPLLADAAALGIQNEVGKILSQASGDPTRFQQRLNLLAIKNPLVKEFMSVAGVSGGDSTTQQAAEHLVTSANEGIRSASQTGWPDATHGESAWPMLHERYQQPGFKADSAEEQSLLLSYVRGAIADPDKIEAMLANPNTIRTIEGNPSASAALNNAMNSEIAGMARFLLSDETLLPNTLTDFNPNTFLGVSGGGVPENPRRMGMISTDVSRMDETYGRLYSALNQGESFRDALLTQMKARARSRNMDIDDALIEQMAMASTTPTRAAIPEQASEKSFDAALKVDSFADRMAKVNAAPRTGRRAHPLLTGGVQQGAGGGQKISDARRAFLGGSQSAQEASGAEGTQQAGDQEISSDAQRSPEEARMNQETQQVIDIVLENEGGYQAIPADNGNWTGGVTGQGRLVGTNMGISAPVLSNYLEREATVEDMKALDEATARNIYENEYIAQPGFDNLPDDILAPVVDMGVNAGPVRAKKLLQRALGVKADGVIGKKTMEALDKADLRQLREAFYQARVSFYEGLAEANPGKYEQFLDGWLARAEKMR